MIATVFLVGLSLSTGALQPLPLHVDGTRLLDSKEQVFHVRGINVPSLEWSAAGEHVLQSISVALDDWKANFIRLPLSQDRWFGKASDSPDDGSAYRAIVDSVVRAVTQRGDHVLLDLHWSDGGVWGANIGQHTLPDAHSIEFWRDCAKRYANQPAVLFDLYNEPIDASWQVWRDGGEVKENFQGKTLDYQAVGLQTLLEAIRGVGAKNLVVAGGLGYSSRLDFPPSIDLKDPGGAGVLYADHFYPGWEDIPSWEKRITPATERLPVIFSEFGSDLQMAPMNNPARRVGQVLAVFKKHDWNWIAWCMHPGAHPCVIADWNYTPTPFFGALVKRAILGEDVPIAPPMTAAPDFEVYGDQLADPWQSWGSAAVDFGSTGAVHSGSKAIAATMNSGQTVQLGTPPFDAHGYRAIRLWLYGGETGGQRLKIQASIMDQAQPATPLPVLKAGEWIEAVVPFSTLGIADKEDVKSFILTSLDGGAVAPFWIDDVTILGN